MALSGPVVSEKIKSKFLICIRSEKDLVLKLLSPYLTGMRQLETSSRIVHDYFVTKINDIKTTFMLQSH